MVIFTDPLDYFLFRYSLKIPKNIFRRRRQSKLSEVLISALQPCRIFLAENGCGGDVKNIEIATSVNQHLCVNQLLGVAGRPLCLCIYIHFSISLPVYSLILWRKDVKTLKTTKKHNFDMPTAYKAPICLLKYTTALAAMHVRYKNPHISWFWAT